MLACENIADSNDLRHELLDAYPLWRAGKQLPSGCAVLPPGAKFLLDDQQTEADTQLVVKMWRPVCLHGCSPFMTPVYSPARNVVGVYLKAASPPPGW